MNESIRLKLLKGSPFCVSNIKILPLTLEQIVDIGYDQYNLCLLNLISEPKDFHVSDSNLNLESVTTWDIIISNIIYGTNNYKDFIKNALELFIGEKIFINTSKECIYINYPKTNKILNRNNYEEFKNILKIQNCIKTKNQEEQFANKKAEEIMKKILKGRQSIQKNESEIYFDDLISTLAANGNGLNILNIWNLTLYQFNNQFNRMKMIEDYEINIRQLLAGAKPEEVDLKYYVRPIDNN